MGDSRAFEVAYEYVQFKNRLENKNHQLEEMEEMIRAGQTLGDEDGVTIPSYGEEKGFVQIWDTLKSSVYGKTWWESLQNWGTSPTFSPSHVVHGWFPPFPRIAFHCIPTIYPLYSHSCEMVGLISVSTGSLQLGVTYHWRFPFCDIYSSLFVNPTVGDVRTSLKGNGRHHWTVVYNGPITHIYIIGDSSKLSHYIPMKRLVWPPISPIMGIPGVHWMVHCVNSDGYRWSHIGNQNDLT